MPRSEFGMMLESWFAAYFCAASIIFPPGVLAPLYS